MRLVFAGTPGVAVPSLQALLASTRHEVVGVVTRPEKPVGRGRSSRSPVAELALEHGIKILTPTKAGDPDFLAELSKLRPDACPVVAYGALLPQSALDIPVHGWINLHFSLLPAWRGAAPVQAAIRAGDEITGASTFTIVRELDAGPVFGTVTEKINPDDTATALLDRLAISGADLLVSTIDGIDDRVLRARPQSADGVSYAPKITVDDARVSFQQSAMAIDRAIRSVTTEPGAWTEFRGERLKLGPVSIVGAEDSRFGHLAPGEIDLRRKEVVVGTTTLPVRLGDVQAPGKKRLTAMEWARGARVTSDERLA